MLTPVTDSDSDSVIQSGPTQIDTISVQGGNLVGHGSVANILMQNNFNVNALRSNSVLRDDEWEAMDNVLIEIGRRRLVFVQEMVSRGLTFNLPNGLGTTILEWERVSDMEPANVSMSGITEGERDILDFDLVQMPIPIIHKDFNINIRKLEASRKTGEPLDMTMVRMASTLVMEEVERMAFQGHNTRVGGAQIYGLENAPNHNVEMLDNAWSLAAATGEAKLDDLIDAIDLVQDDHFYGPYGLWVPHTAYLELHKDFKADGDKAQMQRLLDIMELEFIKPSRDLTDNNIVLQQLTADVMDMVIGMQPTIVSWESNGGMTFNFKVMAIMVPRPKSTKTGQSGIVVMSP